MLCDQAAFILERKDRGAKVTDLAEILFEWAEGSLVHSPHAEKVSNLERSSFYIDHQMSALLLFLSHHNDALQLVLYNQKHSIVGHFFT